MTFPAASRKRPTIPPTQPGRPATRGALLESEDWLWQAPKLYKRSRRTSQRPPHTASMATQS